jgi:hypothetical protein
MLGQDAEVEFLAAGRDLKHVRRSQSLGHHDSIDTREKLPSREARFKVEAARREST